MRAITVRFEIMQYNGLEIEFDETYAAPDSASALLLAEGYRSLRPAPVTMSTRVIADDPYEPGREYRRKNYCTVHKMPMPVHNTDGSCRTAALYEALAARDSAAMLADDIHRGGAKAVGSAE